MRKKTIILALGIALLGAACGGNSTRKGAAKDSTNVEMNNQAEADTSFCGTYSGTLPAADCPGIKTVLTIKADSTYQLTSDYIDQENGHFEVSGVYHMREGNVIELVTPSSGEKSYYKVKDASSVIMTDSTGTEPEGETAKMYVLTK